jgi:hypothetical protein
VAAPPDDGFQKVGVDDSLAAGHTLDDLDVLEKEVPWALSEYLADRGIRQRKDALTRNDAMARNLALHANADGEMRGSLRKLTKVMLCRHHSRIQRAVEDLQAFGVVAVDEGSLETFARYHDPEKGLVGWDWIERPAIRIIPELRATQAIRKLGDIA